MLFAATSCVIGMVIAGGLLSPAGDQNKMRADAGIAFICELHFHPLFGAHHLTARSPVHGLLLGWMDTSASSLPR